MKYLGKLASSPVERTVVVVDVDMCLFKPGMGIEFFNGEIVRTGVAWIEEVYPEEGTLLLCTSLNCIVPAVCQGDSIREYEIPCTRCRCKRCEGQRSNDGTPKTSGGETAGQLGTPPAEELSTTMPARGPEEAGTTPDDNETVERALREGTELPPGEYRVTRALRPTPDALTIRQGEECETCGDRPCAHFLEMLADIESERAWIYNVTISPNVSEAYREDVNAILKLERERLDSFRQRMQVAEARVKALEARPETVQDTGWKTRIKEDPRVETARCRCGRPAQFPADDKTPSWCGTECDCRHDTYETLGKLYADKLRRDAVAGRESPTPEEKVTLLLAVVDAARAVEAKLYAEAQEAHCDVCHHEHEQLRTALHGLDSTSPKVKP